MRRLVAIVEGHGEVRAVPILAYRWLHQQGMAGEFFLPDLAINAKGCGNLKAPYDPRAHRGIEHYVGRALRARPAAILAVLDADDECLKRGPERRLGPELLARARTVAGDVPVGVVVAHREFEAWFLADLASLRRSGAVPEVSEVETVNDPEARTGCKAILGRLLGEAYEPAVHQPELARALSFSKKARALSPSYDKLARELGRLTAEARRRKP
jgi:hypothetical protein